jgi:alanine racemase
VFEPSTEETGRPALSADATASRAEQAPDPRSRAWVEVELDALCSNAEHLRLAAGGSAALLPMVKADAYGLGMVPAARALADAFPDLAGFGVAAVAEGEELRDAGWPGRIVVFTPVPPAEYGRAAAAGLTLCVSEVAAVRRWAAAAAAIGERLPVHVEIDTGMGRAGLPWAAASDWAPAIVREAAEWLEWEGVFTHFHSADEADLGPSRVQWDRFSEALDALPPTAGGRPRRVVHVANSAAALRLGFRCDWVRPGIFLYGGRVGAEPPRPVVSLRSRIVLVREVAAGSTLGYGATHAAVGPERWGTLAIGYGDGLRRSLGPAGGEVLVAGRRVPIIGRISMDMTVVDLTDVPGAEVGDTATLIGRDGDAEITLDEVAELAGTISYEILTGLTRRLPRVYVGESADRLGGPWPRDAAARGTEE